MLRSLYSAVSGLEQHQKAMDVLGNNLSNINTIGYKSGRLTFKDLISQTISMGKAPGDTIGGINPMQIGLGTNVASVDNIFTQGTFQNTGVNTDLALDGNGFFVVRGTQQNERYYTRAGNFTFDRSGYFVDPQGFRVQGWMADLTTGNLLTNAGVTDIQMGPAQMTLMAKQTTSTQLAGNLSTDAQASKREYPALLTYENGSSSLTSVFGENGYKLDLADGEPVRIKADITPMTDFVSVANTNDIPLDVTNFGTVKMIINSTTYDFIYGTGTDAPTTYYFKTVNDFTSKLNTILDTLGGDYNVSVENGKIKVDKNTAGTDVTINSISGNPTFSSALQGLVGNYNSANASRTSSELYYEKVVTANRDFTNLTELTNIINASLNTGVSAGFNASFDTATGSVVYKNDSVANAYDISGFQVDKAYSGDIFESNMVKTQTVPLGADGATDTAYTSKRFLRYASDDTLLKDLFSNGGIPLGVTDGSIVSFDARINGNLPETGNGISYVSDVDLNGSLTVKDLRLSLAGYLGVPQDNVTLENGKLEVTGEKGIKNNIDYITFAVQNGASEEFGTYMGGGKALQSASGGQLFASQTLYDSQGTPHNINYEFDLFNELKNMWVLQISPADPVSDKVQFANGQNRVVLEFQDNGAYNGAYDYDALVKNNTLVPIDTKFTVNTVKSGASDISNVSLNIGSVGNFDGMVLSSGASTITKSDQDGYPRGDLNELSFNDAGEIIGAYSNGEIRLLGQVAVASFTNQEGLSKVGSSLFSETANSGPAAIGAAGTGGRGVVKSQVLENSNVDIAQEFVNMITVQRGYQANSRVITTSDEMIQDLLNLKR